MDYAEDADDLVRAIQSAMDLQTSIIALAGLFADWNGRHTAMLRELQLKRRIFDAVGLGICLADASSPDLPLIYVNEPFLGMSGYAREEVLGRNCRFMQASDTGQKALDAVREALRDKKAVTATLKNFRKDRSVFWNELRLAPLFNPAGELTHYIGVQTDVTARIELEQRLTHNARHDPLTGLPNRAVMMDRLGVILADARRDGTQAAVLFLDLDGFKTINDEFGHETGDQVLRTMGARIKATIRDSDCAARIGGDEFVLVAAGINTPNGPDLLRRRLRSHIEEPIHVGDRPYSLKASIGIAVYPTGATSARDLLHAADLAMYADKRARTEAASVIPTTV